jgi:hypothetical protein
MSAGWGFRIGLLFPALVLAMLALPRFNTGFLREKAFPATDYIETDTPLAPATYRDVARLLAGASHDDSETALLQAEAAINAGAVPASLIPEVEHALSNSPLSARGWIILASLLTDVDRHKAAAAFLMALNLAPREYYLVLPRLLVGAPLWAELPDSARAKLLSDIEGLANDQSRRGQLRLLLARRGGANLLVRAFAGRPEVLRELNRDLARGRLGL